jgi:putative redox protein
MRDEDKSEIQTTGKTNMAKTITVTVNQSSSSTTEGRAREHAVYCDRPLDKGGEDKGAMGGELFLIGLGGCFMSNLLAAIKARNIEASGLGVEVSATLEDAPSRFTEITLRVHGDYNDRDLMAKMIVIAERGCIVANTVRNAVALTVVPA